MSFDEQIMSKDKYPSIFSQPNLGYCVYYPSVLKIGEYPRALAPFQISGLHWCNITTCDVFVFLSFACARFWLLFSGLLVLLLFSFLFVIRKFD